MSTYRLVLELHQDDIDQLTTAVEQARDAAHRTVVKADLAGMTNMAAAQERDAYETLLDTLREAEEEAEEL